MQRRRKKLNKLSAGLDAAAQELSEVTQALSALQSSSEHAALNSESVEDAAVAVEIGELLDDMCTRVEVMAVLDDVCFEVEARAEDEADRTDRTGFSLYNGLSEMDQSGASINSTMAAELNLKEKLVGCEITFKIFVGNEQRQLDGLADIEAEDIAVMIQQQLCDEDSPLHAGDYSKSIVDVKYKIAHTRRRFEHWETFYAHIIHPSFFGYSTKPTKPKSWEIDGDGRLVNGRFASGIAPLNPTVLFNERNKATFQELCSKPILRPPGKRIKRDDLSDDENATVAETHSEGHDLDLNVDEFAQEVKKLKLYRPKMGALTGRDIQRLRRLHKAFEEKYEEEMRKGLVGGGLRPEQYQALKDRDSAYRIYRTARQKYKHVMKGKGVSDELILPPLEVTKIDHATFQGWVDEVRREDQQRLRDARSAAAKRKKILQQEALLRRNAAQKRFWVIDTFISSCENPLDVGHAFEEEMLKLDIQREFVKHNSEDGAQCSGDPATEKLLQELTQKQTDFKKLVISEEKKTRRLFHTILKWSKRRAAALAASFQTETGEALSVYSAFSDMTETNLESKEKEGHILNSEGTATIETTVGAPTEDVTLSLNAHNIVAAASADEESTALRPGTADSKLSRPATAATTTSTNADLFSEDEAPSVEKEAMQAFLELALRALAEEARQLRRAERQAAVDARNADRKRRRESLMAFEGRGRAGVKVPLELLADNDELLSEEDEDEETDKGVALVSLPGSPVAYSRKPFAAGSSPEDSSFAVLSAEEFELVKQIGWIRSITAHKQLFKCLVELPSLAPTAFARDELIQFASIVCEIEPVFAKVLAALAAAKEASEVAMGLRKNKAMEAAQLAKQRKAERDEKRRQRNLARQGVTEEEKGDGADVDAEEAARRDAEKVLEEQKKALEAIARAAEREKAWFMAHPHKFIRHPGEPAFCIVCQEKENEYWMKKHREEEGQWREGFDAQLMEKVENQEGPCRDCVELELKPELLQQAKETVAAEMEAEERLKAEESNPLKMMGRSMKGLKMSSMKLFSAAQSSGNKSPLAPNIDDNDEEAWPRELARIKKAIVGSGLSLVDPRGKSILPKRPPKKAAIQAYVPPVLTEGNGKEEDGGDGEESGEGDALGMRIRVWHRDSAGNRANFLGLVSFTEEEMMKPPKGMRTYPLRKDPAVVELEPTTVSGSIVVMLRATHSDRKNGSNSHWRLEIMRASKLAPIESVHNGMPSEKPPNVFCEVYYKGPALTDSKLTPITEWTLIAHTGTKQNTDSPQFDKETDATLMELPPVWTDRDIPRGQFDGQVQEGGGWVPRNQIPPEQEQASPGSSPQSSPKRGGNTEKRFPFGAKSAEEVVQFRNVVKYNELLAKEVQQRLEMFKYAMTAEERERKCMAQEERQQRATTLAIELARSGALVAKQTEYSRVFMRLLHLVQFPPNILARLRFLMGEESRGGAQKVMCEDPATGKVFTVISTPILRKEDETFMLLQMNSLFGIMCGNLVRIVDFSVHQLRDFNDKGFSSVDERVAIGVLDYIEGITVMQFLERNWENVTNDGLRDLLCQIMNGIRCLHQAGIIHRNIHADAVIVELPNTQNAIKKRTAARPTPQQKQAQRSRLGATVKPAHQIASCYLGDYWFLHNPRSVGCSSSQGRADWGAPSTMPPEAAAHSAALGSSGVSTSTSRIAAVVARRNQSTADSSGMEFAEQGHQPHQKFGDKVTDRSDIFAFGVCLYFWVTKGLHRSLPRNSRGEVDMDTVKRNIPLKWNKWLHSLFDMCLQMKPENRATSKDIHTFLSSRFGK